MRDASRGDGAGHEVARYYDRNTATFLSLGGAGQSFAIHRQLWDGSVANAEQAARYSNLLLARAVAELGPAPLIIDMGCGVGGTLFELARRLPRARLVGVTISRRQYRKARQLAGRLGLATRCEFSCGDFESVALDLEADVIVAVESFAHSRSTGRFFATAAAHLKDGGKLIVVDDFLTRPEIELGAAARRRLEDFRTGWRVPSFGSVDDCVAAAAAARLRRVGERDLTPLIRLHRPKDRIIAALGPVLGRLGGLAWPLLANLVGGSALTAGLRGGLFSYRWLSFEKSRGAAAP